MYPDIVLGYRIIVTEKIYRENSHTLQEHYWINLVKFGTCTEWTIHLKTSHRKFWKSIKWWTISWKTYEVLWRVQLWCKNWLTYFNTYPLTATPDKFTDSEAGLDSDNDSIDDPDFIPDLEEFEDEAPNIDIDVGPSTSAETVSSAESASEPSYMME